MGLAAELESRFGIRIDDAALAEITTVRGLLAAAADATAATSAQPAATPDPRWIAPPGIFSRALGVAVYWLNRLLMRALRSEEHTSELQSLMRISYAVFCLKQTK